MQEYH